MPKGSLTRRALQVIFLVAVLSALLLLCASP